MWFRSRLSSRPRTPVATSRRTTFRPRLEALEGRCVPSTLAVTSKDSTVAVIGP